MNRLGNAAMYNWFEQTTNVDHALVGSQLPEGWHQVKLWTCRYQDDDLPLIVVELASEDPNATEFTAERALVDKYTRKTLESALRPVELTPDDIEAVADNLGFYRWEVEKYKFGIWIKKLA